MVALRPTLFENHPSEATSQLHLDALQHLLPPVFRMRVIAMLLGSMVRSHEHVWSLCRWHHSLYFARCKTRDLEVQGTVPDKMREGALCAG
jgi:hypothetical protein